ncbi:MAG: T9SS type A sorting domain-containing protein, partial [Bacteroidetes bacterium]|nr:T9SS type A sorting domain-containing protein [Bacteroidota bacterium]
VTGGTDSTETSLTAGIYTVTVSDTNGCTDSITAAISNIGGPAITVDLIENADCGAEIGAIYITVSGGTEPYAYLWSSGDTTQDLTGLPAGIYDVTVTDSTNCISTESFEITGAQPPLETICLVTVDSATGKNLIVWEKNQTSVVQSYNIYKESSQINNYYWIGNVPVDSVSVFVDTLSDPTLRSWRYKILVVDSCDNESELSADHKTMHLNINLGIPPAINLIWDHYEGFPFSTYYVTRYTVSTGWVTLDSLASNLTSFTDPTPPDEDLRYVVEVKHPTGCDPNLSKVLTYNSARSNVSNRIIPTGIDENDFAQPIVYVYPNPSNNKITITFPYKNTLYFVNVYDIQGKEVIRKITPIVNSNTYDLDLSQQKSGVYFVKISDKKGITFIKKIVLE